MTAKYPRESIIEANQLVLPNDTNHLDNLMGGRLMYWMDMVSALCAMKHSNRSCVTAAVDNLTFKNAINKGTNAYLKAKITRAFTSSMEVLVQVYSENYLTKKSTLCNEAFFLMVAVDTDTHKPIPVPPIKPETEEEIKQYESAAVRRNLRLFFAKKITLTIEELQILLKQ